MRSRRSPRRIPRSDGRRRRPRASTRRRSAAARRRQYSRTLKVITAFSSARCGWARADAPSRERPGGRRRRPRDTRRRRSRRGKRRSGRRDPGGVSGTRPSTCSGACRRRRPCGPRCSSRSARFVPICPLEPVISTRMAASLCYLDHSSSRDLDPSRGERYRPLGEERRADRQQDEEQERHLDERRTRRR